MGSTDGLAKREARADLGATEPPVCTIVFDEGTDQATISSLEEKALRDRFGEGPSPERVTFLRVIFLRETPGPQDARTAASEMLARSEAELAGSNSFSQDASRRRASRPSCHVLREGGQPYDRAHRQ